MDLEDIQPNQPNKILQTRNTSIHSLDASTSDVIPAVTVLQRLLLKDTGEEQSYSCTEVLFWNKTRSSPLLGYPIKGSFK